MRAALLREYGPPEALAVAEVPEPHVGPLDVLVRVAAAAVNPVDTKIREGYQRAIIRLRLPAVLGMDVSGTVVRVGARVTGFAPGDEVWASPHHARQGCYAELVAIRASEVARKPASFTHVEAASLPLVALTAWDALVRHGKLTAGQRVLIQAGAGGVGTAAIQLARHLGAEVLTTASAKNHELVKRLGAHVAIDYRTERYEDVARDVDLVIDSLGGEDLSRALATVRRGGRIVGLMSGMPEAAKTYGPSLGALVAGLRLARLAARARLTKGVRFMPIARKPDGAVLAGLARLVDEGALTPVVEATFPLEEVAAAHRRLETGRVRGKLVLTVSG